jgi:hypothetical protein
MGDQRATEFNKLQFRHQFIRVFHLADCSRANLEVKHPNSTKSIKSYHNILCMSWFIIAIHDLNSVSLKPENKKNMSRPIRISLIILGLLIVCFSLAMLISINLPGDVVSLQATLEPTLFISP